MRSLLTRLAVLGLIGAMAGCGNASGNALPNGGTPNGSGGGPVQSTIGVGTPPAGAVPPALIDDGTLATGKYVGFPNTVAVDAQNAANSVSDPAPAPPEPSGATDGGSHAITFAGNGSAQETFLYTGATPSLAYQYGGGYFNYGTVVLHLAYAPAAPPPGALSSVAIELVGGSGASAFDVRVPCAGSIPPPAAITAAKTKYTCSLPAYGSQSNTVGPNPILPGASGNFTPFAYKFYIVLNYTTGTSMASTGNVLGVDNVYALQ